MPFEVGSADAEYRLTTSVERSVKVAGPARWRPSH